MTSAADRPAPAGVPTARHHFRPPDPADVVDSPVPPGGETMQGPLPPRPWYLAIAGQWPLFITLVVVTSGVAVAAASFWRRGSTIVALGVLLGAGLRAVLPERVVGLLGCRSKWFDVVFSGAVGLGILVLAWIVSPTRR